MILDAVIICFIFSFFELLRNVSRCAHLFWTRRGLINVTHFRFIVKVDVQVCTDLGYTF
jgi:hypothetical protein